MAIKVDMIGLVTGNMPEAIRFYRLLGLEFPEPDGPYVEASTRDGLRVSLNTIELARMVDPTWTHPAGQSITLAFLCDSAADVDAMYEKVIDAGFEGHKEPWDAFWGQRYAIVTDPDGNHVDLFAPI